MATYPPPPWPPSARAEPWVNASQLAVDAIMRYDDGAAAYLRKQANHAHRAEARQMYREAWRILTDDAAEAR